MRPLTVLLILSSMLLSAAIFGFFYAWVCSTMWGLDKADPRIAIQAMQAMNASVRNATFAPAFFGTPFVLGLTGFVLWRQGVGKSAVFFGSGALVYFFGGMVLTMVVNVPMNEALAVVVLSDDPATAQQIWQDYSPTWQFWNQVRTVNSGLSFLLATLGALYVPFFKTA
ncbi:MAG: DUF1772 domain-containing protein [Cognatishimia sp.]